MTVLRVDRVKRILTLDRDLKATDTVASFDVEAQNLEMGQEYVLKRYTVPVGFEAIRLESANEDDTVNITRALYGSPALDFPALTYVIPVEVDDYYAS